MSTTKLWEKLQGESDKAWEAFVLYRDLGPERSHVKVSDESGKHVTLIARWSLRWHWVDRCREYDNHIDARVRKANETEIIKMRRRHMEAGMFLQGIGLTALKDLSDKRKAPDGKDGAKMSEADALKMVREGVTIERSARGEPDTVQELRSTDVESAIDREARRLAGDPATRRALAKGGRREGSDSGDAGEHGGGTEPGPVAEE